MRSLDSTRHRSTKMKAFVASPIFLILCQLCTGVPSDRHVGADSRLLNGDTAFSGQFPYSVAILSASNPVCSGVLISDRWVLTSASCIAFGGSHQVIIGSTRWDIPDPGSIMETITFTVTDPTNTVGLLEIPYPVDLTGTQIKAATLPDDSNAYAGNTVFLAGWGAVSTGGMEPENTLRFAEYQVLATFGCELTSGAICATNLQNQYPCYGDVGSSLIYRNPVAGSDVVVGLLGGLTSNACSNPPPPPIAYYQFIRVSHFKTWISSQTGL